MTPRTRIRWGATILLANVILATIGYVLVENAGWFDSFYMAIVTISTVGLGEVFDLSAAGRVITIGLMVFGVGTALYTAGAVLELALENLGGRGEGRMIREIEKLSEHHVICGFGNIGAAAWDLMTTRGADVVVVEGDPERAEAARNAGALVVEGDATRNESLEAAGLMRASSLVACVRDDSDNLVIVLSAKALRPDLLVVSRSTEPESEWKLKLAGADRIVAPQLVGARRLAALALQPNLSEYVDLVVEGNLVELRVEQINIKAGSSLAGVSLREARIRERAGASVLAIEDNDQRIHLNPDPDTVISEGHILIAIGTAEQVGALNRLTEQDELSTEGR